VIKEILPELEENVLLKDYTTFKIGGKAKYFYIAESTEDLVKAVLTSKKCSLPFFVLGGGSNILVADKGFNGLVIRILNTKYLILNTKISAEAAVPLSLLAKKSAEGNLTGLEWGIGIPGTVGGAIRGNAGAFGGSMADIIKQVEVYDIDDEKRRILQKQDCEFVYRGSIFKKNPNLIILSTELELQKGEKDKIEEKMKEYLNYRKERQPLSFPSAGSIFKNPSDISAGQLVDQCGLKGKRIGNVQISEKHANFIVNLEDGKAEDVLKLINIMKKQVKDKFNIQLEEEIQYVGFK